MIYFQLNGTNIFDSWKSRKWICYLISDYLGTCHSVLEIVFIIGCLFIHVVSLFMGCAKGHMIIWDRSSIERPLCHIKISWVTERVLSTRLSNKIFLWKIMDPKTGQNLTCRWVLKGLVLISFFIITEKCNIILSTFLPKILSKRY